MRLIDADKLIQELSTMYKQPTSSEDFMTVEYDKAIADVVVTTYRQPSAEPQRTKGEWIFVNKFRGQHKCSVCGVVAVQVRNGFHLESSPSDNTGEHAIVIDHYEEFLPDYCPNCGADMRGTE